MSSAGAHPDLSSAVALSHRVVTAADRGEMEMIAQLDAQRLLLLKSFRAEVRQIASHDQALLQEINELNERALGLMEHQCRIKARALDVATVGRRAVTAYANNRARR